MGVRWVEDVDSGELFPVVDDECFDIPEHLKIADYNEVDYDKTTKYTIGELQNQLLAAQNHINEIQQDSVSYIAPETPVPPVENVKKRFDISEIAKYSLYFFVPLALILVLIASIIGLNYLSDNGYIELRTNENIQSVNESGSKVSVSPYPVYGKIPAYSDGYGMYYYIDRDSTSDNEASTSDTDSSEDTENTSPLNAVLNMLLRIALLFAPIFGIKIGFKLIRNSMY